MPDGQFRLRDTVDALGRDTSEILAAESVGAPRRKKLFLTGGLWLSPQHVRGRQDLDGLGDVGLAYVLHPVRAEAEGAVKSVVLLDEHLAPEEGAGSVKHGSEAILAGSSSPQPGPIAQARKRTTRRAMGDIIARGR